VRYTSCESSGPWEARSLVTITGRSRWHLAVRSLHTSPERGAPQTVQSKWPLVRKGISSGCLIERSCALSDQVLLFNCYTKKKKLIISLQIQSFLSCHNSLHSTRERRTRFLVIPVYMAAATRDSTRSFLEVPTPCQGAGNTDELVADYIRRQFYPPFGWLRSRWGLSLTLFLVPPMLNF